MLILVLESLAKVDNEDGGRKATCCASHVVKVLLGTVRGCVAVCRAVCLAGWLAGWRPRRCICRAMSALCGVRLVSAHGAFPSLLTLGWPPGSGQPRHTQSTCPGRLLPRRDAPSSSALLKWGTLQHFTDTDTHTAAGRGLGIYERRLQYSSVVVVKCKVSPMKGCSQYAWDYPRLRSEAPDRIVPCTVQYVSWKPACLPACPPARTASTLCPVRARHMHGWGGTVE